MSRRQGRASDSRNYNGLGVDLALVRSALTSSTPRFAPPTAAWMQHSAMSWLEERLRLRRRARVDAARSPSRSIYESPALHIRPRSGLPQPTKLGARMIRDEPLTHADLWVDGAGPP
ncbi:hypothetical protein C8R43DRAFT_1140933, partial [Mycena crocata]